VRVTALASGEPALPAAAASRRAGDPYRVVLLDGNMPGMDGFEVASRLRAEHPDGSLAILLLTSAGRRGDAARCRDLGITGYITKPVNQSDLLDALMTVLDPGRGQAAAESGQARPALVTRHSLREDRRRLRVLLAEDNAVNRRVAAGLLEKRGYEVLHATNGREALDILTRDTVDAILMDLQMPVMGGFEATRVIREREAAHDRHTPIIAMTAHAMKGDRERCLQAGMDDYVSKPVKPSDLYAALERAVPRAGAPGGTREPEAAGAPPAVEGAPPVFDREQLLERLEGDATLLEEIVSLYRETCPVLVADLRQAGAARDAEALYRAAHALKGMVAQFGAPAATAALVTIETLGREGDLAGADALIATVLEEIERLDEALNRLERPAA
jgi:CheY-like chemotaxis protein/HPt (histidine-containing phosphotransfer) domain-containing protein